MLLDRGRLGDSDIYKTQRVTEQQRRRKSRATGIKWRDVERNACSGKKAIPFVGYTCLLDLQSYDLQLTKTFEQLHNSSLIPQPTDAGGQRTKKENISSNF